MADLRGAVPQLTREIRVLRVVAFPVGAADHWPEAGIAVGQRVDHAFVLRTRPLGDADLIVTLLGEQSGRVRGVARSARRSRVRFGGALEPLTEVQARWSVKPGRELHQLESLDPLCSHAALQADPGLLAVCGVFAEIVERFAQDDHAEPRVYRLLGAVLAALEDGAPPLCVLRYFEVWTLRLHGLLPALDACEVCARRISSTEARFLAAGAGLLCVDCQRDTGVSAARLGARESAFLRQAMHVPPTRLVAGDEVRRGGGLEQALRGSLEAFLERPLRGYRHLRLLAEDPRS